MLEDEIKKEISEKVIIREKREIAKAFKKQNVAEDIIAQCTGLNIEEIKAIKMEDE